MIPGRFAKAANWSDLTDQPRLATEKMAAKPWLDGKPRHIFAGDMGDLFSKAVTDEYLKRELLGAVESKNGRKHVWIWLTKQIRRLADFSEELGGLPDNVIAMTTITNPRTADVRVPHLLRVKCKTLGVSAEPLLGRVDLSRWLPKVGQRGGDYFLAKCAGCGWVGTSELLNKVSYVDDADIFCPQCRGGLIDEIPGIHWVICGGESGAAGRPMHPEWAGVLRDQCTAAGVAFFFKQWGQWSPVLSRSVWTERDPLICVKPDGDTSFWCGDEDTTWNHSENYEETDVPMEKVGKKASGRLLGGREWNEMPTLERTA